MGKIFVIDGTDGSGKQTQFNLLREHFDKNEIVDVLFAIKGALHSRGG